MAPKRSDLDVASKFLEAQWRGLPFICGPMTFSFDQQLAVHTYPDRDAGFIESTGRNPAVYKFTAYFRNGIAGTRLLFPVKWQEFVVACMDRKVGKLQHPVLGEVKAKLRTFSTSWDPMKRDGADVELEFIEASDAEDELESVFKANAIGNCVAAARDLDDALGNISPVPELPQKLSPSLLESIKGLSGALAQFKLGIGNLGAIIDSYLGAVSELRDQIDSLDDPKSYKALEALDRLFKAIAAVADEAVQPGGKQVAQVEVVRDSSLSAVASSFGMSVEDFLRLNPALASRTTVAKGTRVFVLA